MKQNQPLTLAKMAKGKDDVLLMKRDVIPCPKVTLKNKYQTLDDELFMSSP